MRDAFGRSTISYHLDGLRVAEVVTPPGLALRPHRHEAAQICCVLRGSYSEVWSRREQVMRAGDIFFRPAGWLHENSFGEEEVVTLLISIDSARAPEDAREPFRLAAPVAQLLRMALERELRLDDAMSAGSLQGLATAFLANVRRERLFFHAEPDLVRDASALIEAEYASPLSLSTIARRLGIHRVTLAARFRNSRGITVGEFIRAVRLRRAAAALIAGDARITEIAQATGFSDESHLARLFRRTFGLSPGRFRAAARRTRV